MKAISERPSCPETDCGLNIGAWSMRPLLDSKIIGKREGREAIEFKTASLYKVLSVAESVKRRQIRRRFHSGCTPFPKSFNGLAESWHYMIATMSSWPPSILSFPSYSALVYWTMLARAIAEHSQGSSSNFPSATKQRCIRRVSIHALLHAVIFSRGLEGLFK